MPRPLSRPIAYVVLALGIVGCGREAARPNEGGASLDAASGADADEASAPADVAPTDATTDTTAPAEVDPTPDATAPADAAGDAGTDGADAASDGAAPTQLALVAALVPPMLHLLSLDSKGILTRRAVLPVPDAALEVARSADDRLLYVLGRQVAAFSVDGATASLAPIDELDAGLPNWMGLVVDPARRWLVVSDRMRGVMVLGLDPSGGLVADPGAGVSAQIADDVTFDPSGKFVFAPSCDADRITRYGFDGTTGALLAPATPVQRADAGPRRVVFHPSGKTAYVINAKEQTVTSFDYDAAAGTLAAPETISLVAPTTKPLLGSCRVGHLVVHPSRKLAYATTTESGGAVTIMAVAASGRLSVVDHELFSQFRGADPLAIDPTGTYLLVGNTSISTHVFRIDPTDGRLTFVSGGVAGVYSLQLLPSTAG